MVEILFWLRGVLMEPGCCSGLYEVSEHVHDVHEYKYEHGQPWRRYRVPGVEWSGRHPTGVLSIILRCTHSTVLDCANVKYMSPTNFHTTGR